MRNVAHLFTHRKNISDQTACIFQKWFYQIVAQTQFYVQVSGRKTARMYYLMNAFHSLVKHIFSAEREQNIFSQYNKSKSS